jgi:uncharacterized protein (DUF1330 family)
MKWILMECDHENADLVWRTFESEEEAREAYDASEYKCALIYGDIKDFNV